ncbi:MAG TPA: sigma-70 family RNA polymerase sigma factor [Polyangiaceae bacterium]|jgi:RNA polymerase sigma-70 factor (ECF subfamily)|nr:sigma-70 family RNA polymerase sigma factor [Polyangiaceae bacterium]
MNASHPLSAIAREIPTGPVLGAEELFRLHAPFVVRMLARMGMPPDAIDDAVQEVFLVVHRQGGYRPGAAKPTTYLANLALHAASAHRRRQRVRVARESDVPADETASAEVGASERLETGESLRRLGAALDRLEPSLRATLVLAEIEGETCPSIAASMRVPLGTVYWRLHRARKELRSALKKVDAAPRRTLGLAQDGQVARREHALALPWLVWPAWPRMSRWARSFARALGTPVGGLLATGVVVGALVGVAAAIGVARAPSSAPVAVAATMAQATACRGCAGTDPGWTAVAADRPAGESDAVPVELLPLAPRAVAPADPAPVMSAARTLASSAAPAKHDARGDRAAPAVEAPVAAAPAAGVPVAGTPAAAADDAIAPPDAAVAELHDVAEAERLLAISPARALALVEATDARYPRGYLREERGYVRVMALLALQRTGEARPLAAIFLRAYPDGAFARRVRAAAQAAHVAP